MATRLTVQAPKTGRADETIKYRCDDCDTVDIENPINHAKIKHKERHIIVDNRHMMKWYGGVR